MGRISAALEFTPGLGKRQIREAAKGKMEYADEALEFLISDGYVRREVRGQAHLHYLIRPYPDSGEGPRSQGDRVPDTGTRSEDQTVSREFGSNTACPPCPDRVPDTGTRSERGRVPVSPSLYGDTGHGLGPEATEHRVLTLDDALQEKADFPSATGCTHPKAHRSSWKGDTCVRCRSEANRLGRVVVPADPLEGAGEDAFLAAMYAMPDEDHR